VRVSVVIPTYNRAARVPSAIESVLRQGVDDLEIVVVDDGSTDDTESVVARYGAVVRYVRQPNRGVGAARNAGMRHATGDVVAFLDSDDRWQDFKLSMQLRLMAVRSDVGMVFSDFVIERADGSIQPNGAALWAGRPLTFPGMEALTIGPSEPKMPTWPAESVACWVGPMYRQLLDELPILTSSVIVRRNVLDEGTWYAEGVVLFEDWEFFARVARRAPVGFVSEATTINVGHLDPGRVSKCSSFDRARSYRTLLERVWMADREFVSAGREDLVDAYGRALLAETREALLMGDLARVGPALEQWRRLGASSGHGWATLYAACARSGGSVGPLLLKSILRGRAAVRLLAGHPVRRQGTVSRAA